MNFRRAATCVFLLAFAALSTRARAVPEPAWSLVRSANFEVYSQGDNERARASLLWFEQLRAFFLQAGVPMQPRPAVRVIGFRSVKEYEAYQLRPVADAYYVGTDSQDYIVMPSLGAGQFGVAAHEYAHVALHSSGVHLPAWLNEGLAEFFSTVRIGGRGCELGGDIRLHSQTLRQRPWLPLAELFQTNPEALARREQMELFYTQSWALTRMLLLSPAYRTRVTELVARLSAASPSESALSQIYGKSFEDITRDLRSNDNRMKLGAVIAPGVAMSTINITSSELSGFAARSLLGELLLASGQLERAEALYLALAHESPSNPDVAAGLGTVALRKGNLVNARLRWRQALEQGTTDAELCYRYAVLADDAGVPADEIAPALQRAIALRPDFDDARFKLALLESNASHYGEALSQLAAMEHVTQPQAFVYWLTTAFAQDQVGRHDQSKLSAQKALQFAATDQERSEAIRLAYIADTELTVQFARDPNGNLQVTTARKARGTETWNPFIEPEDRIRHAEGQLRSVECGSNDKITGISIDTQQGSLKLAIPDPLHVLIKGANEFTCGPQPANPVKVEYAAAPKDARAGVLRGLEILRPVTKFRGVVATEPVRPVF